MKELDNNKKVLLSLVRNALQFTNDNIVNPEWDNADWNVVEKLAQEQGVLWMLYLGARSKTISVPADRLKAWRASFHAGVIRNDQINAVQNELLSWLEQANIDAVVIKGISCSRYYPYPIARTLGDIDILVDYESIEQIGEYLISKGYRAAECEHGFHVGYYGMDAVIEVHHSLTETPMSVGGENVKEALAHFLENHQKFVFEGVSIPVLSNSHQALMLLLHMERHMMEGGIGLRQLCDWACFVNGAQSNDWQSEIIGLLQRCGLLVYAKVLTKVCVKYLGLPDDNLAWCNDVSDEMTKEMIGEVFRGGDMGKAELLGSANILINRRQLGQRKKHRLTGLLSSLTHLSYQHFPILNRRHYLLPVFWVYLPLRFWIRSITGKHPKHSVANAWKTSNRRQQFYSKLHLYEVE